MKGQTHLVTWPLGTVGRKVLLVLADEVDPLVPVLVGEPPEMIPATIPNLDDIDVSALAAELAVGPSDVWLVLPRSDRTYDFADELNEVLMYESRVPVATAFLPTGIGVKDLVSRLPTGRRAVAPGQPPRQWHLQQALFTLWAADAPDPWLGKFALAQAEGFSLTEI